jgi:hypothetical protein
LPTGYLNAVYQKKLHLQTQAHYRELEELGDLRSEAVIQNVAYELMHKKLLTQADARTEDCLRAGCKPNGHRSCLLNGYLAGPPKEEASAEGSGLPLLREKRVVLCASIVDLRDVDPFSLLLVLKTSTLLHCYMSKW